MQTCLSPSAMPSGHTNSPAPRRGPTHCTSEPPAHAPVPRSSFAYRPLASEDSKLLPAPSTTNADKAANPLNLRQRTHTGLGASDRWENRSLLAAGRAAMDRRASKERARGSTDVAGDTKSCRRGERTSNVSRRGRTAISEHQGP